MSLPVLTCSPRPSMLQILKRAPQAAVMSFAAFMWLNKEGGREVRTPCPDSMTPACGCEGTTCRAVARVSTSSY